MQPEPRPSGDAWIADLPVLLAEGLEALDLPLSEAVQQQLLHYLQLLSKWNQVYNLTGIRQPREMLVQHLLDALAVLPRLRAQGSLVGAQLADVGSGAGLPGLPLAIAEPGLSLLSIEPTGKKAAFQRQACAELALTNVRVIEERAESVSQPVDRILCRAFASLQDFIACSQGLAGPSTRWVALKGRQAEIEAERAALPPDWPVEVEALQVPGLSAERHLVWVGPLPVQAAPLAGGH